MHAQLIPLFFFFFFFFSKLSIPIRNVRLSPVLGESYPLFYHFSVRRKIGVISLEIDTCPARCFHDDFTSVTRRHVTTSTSGWRELTFPSKSRSFPRYTRDPEARVCVSFRDQFFLDTTKIIAALCLENFIRLQWMMRAKGSFERDKEQKNGREVLSEWVAFSSFVYISFIQ